MGDFNSVLHVEDRIGGNQVTHTEIVDFEDCLDACGLVKMPSNGCNYTWTDKQDDRIFSKIDWVFVNGDWLDGMPDCRANVCQKQPTKRKQVFKYGNVWGKHPEFQRIVEAGWNIEIVEYKMFQVARKLKLLKKQLKLLHKQHFNNIVKEAHDDRAAMLECQIRLQQDPTNVIVQQEEKVRRLKYKESAKMAEMFLLQRIKATWIKLGDDNTKYFFSIIKQRKLVHSICQIRDELNQIQTEPEVIEKVFVRYYKQLLGETGGIRRKAHPGFFEQGPRLSIEEQCGPLKTFTEREIRDAMFGININKSP
ncbi:uncharacterized protein LOC132613259 [Lycium barbarum]|uniref:uncharacterized protein LOC132613259 n=1 Tax=Lycium barbarum TaxID=112863 RepID=UPI00293E7C61|nr:uncharacterized protein LOC132613259 [Lycium barbarum]